MFEGKRVWGHAGTYVTVFALRGEEETIEGRRKIIGRIFHEIRARSTVAKKRFDEVDWANVPESEVRTTIDELLNTFENQNEEIQRQIEAGGKITDASLSNEFKAFEFDEQVSSIRDYAAITRRDFLKYSLLLAGSLAALYAADKLGVIKWAVDFISRDNPTQFMSVEEKLAVIKRLTETIQDSEIVVYGSTQEISGTINLRNELVNELLGLSNSEVRGQVVEALLLKEAEKQVFKETGFIIEGATRYREITYISGLLKVLPNGHLKGIRSVFVTRIALDSSQFGEGKRVEGFYSRESFIAIIPFGYLKQGGYLTRGYVNHELGHNAQKFRTDPEKTVWETLYSADSGEASFVSNYGGTNAIEDNAEIYRYWTTYSQSLVNLALQRNNIILQKKILELILSPRQAEPFLRFKDGKAYLYIFKANHRAEIELPFRDENEITNDPINSFKILHASFSLYAFEGYEFRIIRLIENNEIEKAVDLVMQEYGDATNTILPLNEKLEDLFAQLMWIDFDSALKLMLKIPHAYIADEDIKKYFNVKTPALRQFIEETVLAEKILSVFGVTDNASVEGIVGGIQEMGIGTFYEENNRDFYFSRVSIGSIEITHGDKITNGLGIALARIMLKDIEKLAQVKHLLDESYKKLIESGKIVIPSWSLLHPLTTFMKLYPDKSIEILKEHRDITIEFIISEGYRTLLPIIELDNEFAIEIIEIIERSGKEDFITEAFRLMMQFNGIDAQDVRKFWNYAVTSKGEDWLKIRIERYFNDINKYLEKPETAKSYEGFIKNTLIPSLQEIGKGEPDLSGIISEALRDVFGNRFIFSTGNLRDTRASI